MSSILIFRLLLSLPDHPFVVTQSRDIAFSRDSSHSKPNELLRSRELLRYFTPPSIPQTAMSIAWTPPSSVIELAEPLVDLDQEPAVEDVPTGADKQVLKSSDDLALRAFSHLLALKLDCERSLISLIDRTNQYVVAEATRTLSIADPTQQSGLLAPDGLWLGCATILAEGGLCVNTIQLYPDDENEADKISLLEIQDLTLDSRFNTCDYVLNYPHLRFYAGTPLRTKRGYNIGSICVVDSSPRVLNIEEKKTLGWMGKVVMQHLEMKAEVGALRRNQRMVESLGRFVAGKNTLTDDIDSGSGSSSSRMSEVQPGETGRGSESPLSLPLDGSAGTLEKTFSRAGVLVRAALMTDGVVFVDADEVYDTSSFPRREGSTGREHPGLSRRRTGGILGHSRAIKWDYIGEKREDTVYPSTVNEMHGNVPSDGIIQQMLDLYPLGTIISFDKQIPSASSLASFNNIVDENSFPDTLSMSEEEIFHALQEFIPGCASVLFMPLWNNGGKPYAASFSWTYDVLRVFTSDELSYMQGFMSSIMSVVSRLNTMSADKAKGDFISSISHELRSPLHGVLASTEFLAETTLDEYQRRFVNTVESCGRMLLDTINHVLDFRKLTSLVRDQQMISHTADDANTLLAKYHHASRQGNVEPFHGRVASLIEATDIIALTEHVVECVYAGYEFKGISSLGVTEMTASTLDASLQPSDIELLSNRSGLSNMRGASHYAREAVTVILDFEKRDNWTFMTQPGAMRRILMNIFANALKYTDSGWVRVQLQAEDLPLDQDIDNKYKSKITLTVSDSGRGIGREFLKTKLFTPFSQEDTLASGTGLGMSIVQQIVQLLGGNIDVKSQVNVGTAVTVTFVLEWPEVRTVSDDSLCEPESPLLLRSREHTVGKTICLVGFDSKQPIPSTDCDTPHTLASLQKSLARYTKEWFGMHVVTGTLETKDVDIFLANESDDTVRYLEENPKKAAGRRTPLIVLCSNVSRYRDYASQGDHVLKFASKPCGPMKLAKALQFCFERFTKLDELAHMPTSTFSSSHPDFSGETERHHYQGSLSEPALVKPTADVEQNTLVAEMMDIQGAGFATSPLTRASSLSLHPVSAILNPAPILRMSAEELVKPLGPTPNVLIVEDNPINLMLLATFIRKRKYPFTKAVNGLLGVEAVKARPGNFDVILMDLQMPVMSGFEAIKAIRKLEAESIGIMKRSVIIAITGLADSDDIDEAYRAGVDLFLTKPVPLKTVDRELDRWKERAVKLAAVGSQGK